MRAYVTAMLVATTTISGGGFAWAQSSSPFSGLFSRDDADDGPVDLDITVEGGDDSLATKIRQTSLISAALSEDRTTGQDVLAAARGDYARILGVLYDNGFYDAVVNIRLDGVEAAEVALLDAPDAVARAHVVVIPGPAYKFVRADLAPIAPGSEIPPGFAVGETAGTGVMRRAALAGVEGWRNYGHAKADVGGQQITADHDAQAVDTQIGLDPGPAVTFGRLNVSGNRRLKERRLRKIAGFPEGERFDPEKTEDVRKRLRRSGVFSAITLEESETLNADDSMDMDLTVVEQRTRRIGAGFEISNTDGVLLSGYWMHRNLFGGGERLRVEAEVKDIGSETSGRDDEYLIRLERPATLTADTTGYIEFEAEQTREEDYDEDVATLGLGFNHIFNDQLTGDIALEYQFSRAYDDDLERDFKVLALPMDITWDKRDDANNAKRGFWLSGDATPFYGFEDTDSGLRALGEGRAYYSFGDDRFTLAGRARLGTIVGSEIENTPRNYLFYSGGGGTVRGHPYESLGVEVIEGSDGTIKTGGMSTATATAEFRFQVREKIGLVAFADYGRVWEDGAFDGGSGEQVGAGVGVRYDTPVGPLRFDVAGPVSGDTANGVQLYLGLGQAF
ncbi:autotransporter assembly complex family protein [Paracoccus sp. 1_MG-2023]|uniref:autotransporter assembly complex protein TamA n=1 Tax=unclassified Paracoccus (in: a-proteobacteria) TaxID=2688777 RepID=UPI001C09D307|nr:MULTISPECIES: autotransporter assembly complex family protein [unclassified Paracoccus (in: a-proteobacteria)]MBU2957207.1 autotransporter assembly complex protein TamA [Paracoccus sp. C2R09]MDO6669094.1 autotransporter assembly complex family protein [Paracoccus sp. 1_MG-2023]